MNTTPAKTVLHWSGGKDCAITLQALNNSPKYSVERLFTAINQDRNRVTMHGVRRDLIERQAREIGLPISFMELPDQPGMDVYNQTLKREMNDLKEKGITHAAFGDIYLEDLKTYREKLMKESGLQAVFPLWKKDTKKLFRQCIDDGFKACVVSVQEDNMGRSFAGRELNNQFLNDLPGGIDPCGENGEFHTFVYDGPIFRNPIAFKKGDVTYRDYPKPQSDERSEQKMRFWFCDLLPE